MTTHADELWQAVCGRDASAAGLFVYAVRSTGIYCRPGCASRRPARARVEFFPSGAMAVGAGYRPCLRCRPDEPAAPGPGQQPLWRACRVIASAPHRRWTSAQLAQLSGATEVSLRRAFRARLGLTPRDYIAACRRRRFVEALSSGRQISAAIYEAGYGSPSRVYERGRSGVTPGSVRNGGREMDIRWRTVASPIGRILVAATTRGVCFVAIGADDTELVAALRYEYPRAAVEEGRDGMLREIAQAAQAVAQARAPGSDVPADIAGTAFQWRVWRALTKIPAGQTRSYADVARAIGAPSAIRATARACATNPLALLVPCHRVVGSDGSLRGYRWGLPVKEALLVRESRPLQSSTRPAKT